MAKKEKYIKIKHYKNSTYYTVQFDYEFMGERRSYSKTFSTMKEAVQHRDLKRAELITQGLPYGTRTVAELLEDYITINRLKLSTANRKRIYMSHVKELYNIQISKLTPYIIQKALNSMIYEYSQEEIRGAYTTLVKICDTAVLKGHLNVSPMGRVTQPKSQKITHSRPKTASDVTIEEVIAYLESHPVRFEYTRYNYTVLKCFLEVIMYTGMRPSEAFALKRSNVDLATGIIHIETRIGSDEISTGVETKLKTGTSERSVPISAACAETFAELMSLSDNEYLFTMWSGKLMYIGYVDQTIRTIAKELGLNFTPYMLRHRAATRIIVDAKADPRTAMEILGHSNIRTTLQYYSHSNESEKIRAIDIVEKSRKPS